MPFEVMRQQPLLTSPPILLSTRLRMKRPWQVSSMAMPQQLWHRLVLSLVFPWSISRPIMNLMGWAKSLGNPMIEQTHKTSTASANWRGEMGIRTSGEMHAILSTFWVVSAHGGNFVKTMLRLSQTRDALSMVADQIGGPTPARDIATACLEVVEQLLQYPSKSGTYHFSRVPNVSWEVLATKILEQAGKSMKVTHIPTKDYPTPAKRPLNSNLDCRALAQIFGVTQPNWRYSLKVILRGLEAEA